MLTYLNKKIFTDGIDKSNEGEYYFVVSEDEGMKDICITTEAIQNPFDIIGTEIVITGYNGTFNLIKEGKCNFIFLVKTGDEEEIYFSTALKDSYKVTDKMNKFILSEIKLNLEGVIC